MSTTTIYWMTIVMSVTAILITAMTVASTVRHNRKMQREYEAHRARMARIYGSRP